MLAVAWICCAFVVLVITVLDRMVREGRPSAPTAVKTPPAGDELVAEPTARHLDPGKQALMILQRGDDCDWYSIVRNDEEMHEGFDCLEIYWRTQVSKPSSGYGRQFEERAGFRVRWHVAASDKGYIEAYGLDLMSTILEARALVDQHVERGEIVRAMGYKHPTLEEWKKSGVGREYDFGGLDLKEWRVNLRYPNGRAWAKHEDLNQAVYDALARAGARA